MHYFENRLKIEWEILNFFNLFANNIITYFFIGISYLGEGVILIALIFLFYFALDKEFAKKLAFITTSSLVVNNIFKVLCHAKRPFQFEGHEGLRKAKSTLDTATGTSFPSGHSQNTGALYTTLFRQFNKKWIRIVCIVLLVLIPISRLYLGVHFPGDVIVGLALGIGMAFGMGYLYDKFHGTKWFYLIGLGVILISVPFMIINWNVVEAKDLFTCLGLFLGAIISFYIEEKWINFTLDVVWWKRLLRVVVAAGIGFALRAGLKLIFPSSNIFDFIRYLLVVIIPMGVLPFAFKKTKKEEVQNELN